MRHIKASEFKAKCLQLMDDVKATGETIVITKNGEPVARLGPNAPPKKIWTFGQGKGQFEIVGDIVNPMPNVWNFDRWPKEPRKRGPKR
jgi:prevent-host-death family protein